MMAKAKVSKQKIAAKKRQTSKKIEESKWNKMNSKSSTPKTTVPISMSRADHTVAVMLETARIERHKSPPNSSVDVRTRYFGNIKKK